jgi:hypothetical protein
MNDNIEFEGQRHLFASNLLNDLMVVLGNAARNGVDVMDSEGLPIYDFEYWSRECAKALGVRKIAP